MTPNNLKDTFGSQQAPEVSKQYQSNIPARGKLLQCMNEDEEQGGHNDKPGFPQESTKRDSGISFGSLSIQRINLLEIRIYPSS